jgi:hypothetical protein
MYFYINTKAVYSSRTAISHILSVFRNIRKIAKSDYQLRHISPFVCPHGTARFPQDGFSQNFILRRFFFRKSVEKIKLLLKSDKNNGTLHEDQCTFMTRSRWILLWMRNFSDDQNIHFIFNNFFSKNRAIYEIMEKNNVEPERPQTTIKHGACALHLG